MGVTDHYRKIEDIPNRFPLFPLPEAILLPRTNLPLNIFEPRYLAMVDDVLAGNRLIGMVQPVNEGIAGPGPIDDAAQLRKFGCVGRLTAFQESDDGHCLITLTGIARFETEFEIETDKPYRVWDVAFDKFKSDLVQGFGEDDIDRDYLLSVLKEYLKANSLDADWSSIRNSSNEFLVNTLSIISPYGVEEKQALLEAVDLKTRAQVLIALAQMELATPDDGSGTKLQ